MKTIRFPDTKKGILFWIPLTSSGTLIAEWDTDSSAHKVEKLYTGDKYILRETKAPE